MPEHTNHLIDETSPYLLQHAHNPVNWYPWSDEAFTEAKRLDKPVLLSVGYAACHWCHVMERESFENEQIASLMNDLFISIKVDREERPDIDQVYMRFVQMAAGNGGWPMTVFLTPDKKPFFGGTYFPPEDRYGRPGFPKVLKSIDHYYHNEKDQLKTVLNQVETVFTEIDLETKNDGQLPDKTIFNQAVEKLSRHYEPEYGGIGQAPKFPAAQAFQLFLRKYYNDRDDRYLRMIEMTLENMGKGGIFDQIGGGFARYSVDNEWLVPHFEKMLYDNAQLTSLYLDTYLMTKNIFYLNIAVEILNFVEREMLSVEGGFYSSLDADSEGEEGKFYTWTPKQVLQLLGEQNGSIFCNYYDISENGNFEGRNIPRVISDKPSLQQKFAKAPGEVDFILSEGKKILLDARSKRTRPSLDDKVIVSWNGLMLSAFARAYQVTGVDRYAEIIRSNVTFLQKKLVNADGLFHTYKNNQARIVAFLDDYANLIQGLIDAYEAIFNIDYLKWAVQLTDFVNSKFMDSNDSGYFYTSSDQEQLLIRLRDEQDQSIPSANGVMLMNLIRLSAYTGNKQYQKTAESLLSIYKDEFSANPYAYCSYLSALDFYLNKPKEIIIVSEGEFQTDRLLNKINSIYYPNKIKIYINTHTDLDLLDTELIKGKHPVDHKTTVYICTDHTCSPPLNQLELLENYL